MSSIRAMVLDLLDPTMDAAVNAYVASLPIRERATVTDERCTAVRRLVIWRCLRDARERAASLVAKTNDFRPRRMAAGLPDVHGTIIDGMSVCGRLAARGKLLTKYTAPKTPATVRGACTKLLARAQSLDAHESPWAVAYTYLLAEGSFGDAYGESAAFGDSDEREVTEDELLRRFGDDEYESLSEYNGPSMQDLDARGQHRPTSVGRRVGARGASKPVTKVKVLFLNVGQRRVRIAGKTFVRGTERYATYYRGKRGWVLARTQTLLSVLQSRALDKLYRLRAANAR